MFLTETKIIQWAQIMPKAKRTAKKTACAARNTI